MSQAFLETVNHKNQNIVTRKSIILVLRSSVCCFDKLELYNYKTSQLLQTCVTPIKSQYIIHRNDENSSQCQKGNVSYLQTQNNSVLSRRASVLPILGPFLPFAFIYIFIYF